MEDIKEKIYRYAEEFAKNLRLERQSRGYTQKFMAESIGVKTQSYQAYESGVSMPTLENLLKLVVVLDLSLDDLFNIR